MMGFHKLPVEVIFAQDKLYIIFLASKSDPASFTAKTLIIFCPKINTAENEKLFVVKLLYLKLDMLYPL